MPSDLPSRAPETPLSQRPVVLHAASIERLEESEQLFEGGAWALSMYTAGLAVEALLQAFAHRAGAPHDARHDLRAWLSRCSRSLVDAIRDNADDDWIRLNMLWDNALRYLSESGLLGYLRGLKADRGIKGDRVSVLRVCTRRCLDSARVVHNKGLVQWSRR